MEIALNFAEKEGELPESEEGYALILFMVLLTLGIGGAILAESGLSFLTLVDDAASWGSALSAAREGNYSHWWILLFPAMFIFLAVISFNLLGEHLRDILDPRDRGGSEKTLPRI